MSKMNVSENIKFIESHMAKIRDQIVGAQSELLRLEGSLNVFKQLSDAGVEHIPVPKDEVLE